MAESLQSLVSLSELVSTSSTNQRVRIFHREIPAILNSCTSDMSTELALLLTDIIFRTFSIYDDRRSRKAVDDVIVRALGGTVFMKTFAAALVQNMEKQLKFQSSVGCYRLLSWSCLLLSKNIHKLYVQELKNGQIPYKDSPELLLLLLEFSSRSPSLFGEFKARHADEGRRDGALAIVRSLSQKSSNPDALDAMFNAIKAVIKGSEGRLAFPYQRVGMVNAIEELSNAPDGKYLVSLSHTICDFLLSYYKDDGNEEVKIVILSALASWTVRSPDIIQESLLSFLVTGLKEKETLRRGFLRSLRTICKNADAVLKVIWHMSPLLGPLVQLVKTGFTKAVQRLDGLYALLLVGKIAAVDIKADEMLVKEKIWAVISQNEPSLVPISTVITLLKTYMSITQVLFNISEKLLCRHQSYQLRIAWHVLIFLKCFFWNIYSVHYPTSQSDCFYRSAKS
ncbi:Armadillo-type fold [Sesbania bispinosa]|nr:Armadillo-type fold [Sesbania bispinosa]